MSKDIEDRLREIVEHEKWSDDEIPESQEKLCEDLRLRNAPEWMVTKAEWGMYHDYRSPHPMPKHLLVKDANIANLPGIAERTRNGEYDP